MDLLDRLLGHDAWTTHQLLLCCKDLTDEQLDRQFDIGHRTVRATLSHIIRNVEVWSDLMGGQPLNATSFQGNSIPDMITRLEHAAGNLARVARTIAQRGAWDDCGWIS